MSTTVLVCVEKLRCKRSSSLDVDATDGTSATLCEPLVNTRDVEQMHARQTTTQHIHQCTDSSTVNILANKPQSFINRLAAIPPSHEVTLYYTN